MTKNLLLIVLFALLCAVQSPEAVAAQRIFFSPADNLSNVVVSEVDKAETSIDTAIYYFSCPAISRAFHEAHKRGVSIRIICDASQQSKKVSRLPYLRDYGINIRVGKQRGLMHLKFTLIDGSTILHGSANYSKSASERNSDYLMTCDDTEVVAAFQQRFKILWEDSLRFRQSSAKDQRINPLDVPCDRFNLIPTNERSLRWLALLAPCTRTQHPGASRRALSSPRGRESHTHVSL